MKKILLILAAIVGLAGSMAAQDTLYRPSRYLYAQESDTFDSWLTTSHGGVLWNGQGILHDDIFQYFWGKEFVVRNSVTVYGVALCLSYVFHHWDTAHYHLNVFGMLLDRDNGQYIRLDSVRRVFNIKNAPDYYYAYRVTDIRFPPDYWHDGTSCTAPPLYYFAPLYEYYFPTPHVVKDTFYIGYKSFNTTCGENNYEPDSCGIYKNDGVYPITTASDTNCPGDTAWWLTHDARGLAYPWYPKWIRMQGFHNGIYCILTPPDADALPECPTVGNFHLKRYYNHCPIFEWADTTTRNYQIAYGPAGSDPDSCRHVPCNGWPYQLTDNTLDTNILYHAFIRQECYHECPVHDTNYWSAWSQPVPFYTGTHAPDTGQHTAAPALPPLAFDITPNPAHDRVSVTSVAAAPYQVSMVDESGRQLVSFTVQESAFVLDISAFPAGIYYLTLKSGRQSGTQKVVKQ